MSESHVNSPSWSAPNMVPNMTVTEARMKCEKVLRRAVSSKAANHHGSTIVDLQHWFFPLPKEWVEVLLADGRESFVAYVTACAKFEGWDCSVLPESGDPLSLRLTKK